MRIFLIVVLCLTSMLTNASLLVTPSRIAFSETDRTQNIILVNSASTTKSYRLEWVNLKQLESGSYQALTDEELTSFPRADKILRFSPRRVTLQPGESQKIKVMVRRNNKMNEAEYRSHLRFTALPNELVNAPKEEEKVEGVQMRLNLLLSYSIPIIVRTQPPGDKVTIDSFAFNQAKQAVSFNVNRLSDTSIYGDFTVVHEVNGTSTDVGYLNGVNIFSELASRNVNISLINPLNQYAGKLRIEYKGSGELSDKDLASAEIVL